MFSVPSQVSKTGFLRIERGRERKRERERDRETERKKVREGGERETTQLNF